MKRFLCAGAGSALLAALLSVSGCAVVGSQSAAPVLLQLDDVSTGAIQTRPAMAEVNGQPALLYANKDNRIVFRVGKKTLPLDETAPVQGGSRFKLYQQGDKLDALWWSHEKAKNLYFTSSVDAGKEFFPVSIVNDDHGVLATFSLLRGPNGVLGMTYLDERLPRYQTYFNRSTDAGRTWARPDVRLDVPPADDQASAVQEPQSVESGTAWVSAWIDAVRVPGGRSTFRVLSRRSVDAGLTWSAPEVLYNTEHLISSLTVKAQGDRIVIAADDHRQGILALVSIDQGRSWRNPGVLEGTGLPLDSDGSSNSSVQVALKGDLAHLVWVQEHGGKKAKIMRARIDLVKNSWLEPVQQMDVKTNDSTRSMTPDILAVANGPLLASWIDYRDIRPNVYLSASFDDGAVWSAPQPLLAPGMVSAGLPRLMPWRNQVAISYDVYPADVAAEGKFVLRLIPLDQDSKALPGFVSMPTISEAERKAKLEKRVKLLWDSRVAGNFEPTFDIFDYAYKATTTKKTYLQNIGVITYLSSSTEVIVINGNEAVVKMKLKYEVKQTTLSTTGKPFKLVPTDVVATNTWVWVGDEWYLVYAPAIGSQPLSY